MSQSENAVEDLYQELEKTARQEFQNFKDLCAPCADLMKLGALPLLQHKFKFMGNQIAINAFSRTDGLKNAGIFEDQKFGLDYVVQFLWHGLGFTHDLNLADNADTNSKGEKFELTKTQKLLTTLALSLNVEGSPLFGIPGIVDHFVSSVAMREQWENVRNVLS